MTKVAFPSPLPTFLGAGGAPIDDDLGGVAVIRWLLANDADLITVVPADQIIAGGLPLKTAMPAISIEQVSSVPLNFINVNEADKLHTDRVQVTVYRKLKPEDLGYAGLKPLLNLVLAACPSQRGVINGVHVENITPDIEGPDGAMEEYSVVTRSRDFLVRWVGA